MIQKPQTLDSKIMGLGYEIRPNSLLKQTLQEHNPSYGSVKLYEHGIQMLRSIDVLIVHEVENDDEAHVQYFRVSSIPFLLLSKYKPFSHWIQPFTDYGLGIFSLSTGQALDEGAKKLENTPMR